jgi:hypothetical protein
MIRLEATTASIATFITVAVVSSFFSGMAAGAAALSEVML